jgi:uncharacterized membrane protein YhaH (DUF805 family)
MSFADAVRTCLTAQYATFSGRARRSEFWWFVLFVAITEIALFVVGAAIKFPLLGALAALGLVVPHLAVTVRRLHDTGKSGFMILLGILPLVGAIILLIFYVTDSTPAGDRYGPSPKDALVG